MELNDIMRLQEKMIKAANKLIKAGGEIGRYSPAISPMGALYWQYVEGCEGTEIIDRVYCQVHVDLLSESINIDIDKNILKYFWLGFDLLKKPKFTAAHKNDNLDYIYEIGQFMRNKYDPIEKLRVAKDLDYGEE